MPNEPQTTTPTAPAAPPVPTEVAKTAESASTAPSKAPESAPKAPETSPKAQEPRESARFAALARKERALVEEQRKIAAVKDELGRQYAQLQAFEQQRAQAKQNPLAALEAMGITYDDLSNFILNDQKPTPDLQLRQLQDELSGLKKAQEEERQRLAAQQEEYATAQQAQVVEEFGAEIAEFVKQNSEKYEYVSTFEQAPLVLEVIRETFETTGQIISTEEAAQMVEDHLEGLIGKASETKKWKAKAAPPLEEGKKPSPAAQPAQTKTLTNTITASTPLANGSAPKNEEERLARALAAAEAARQKG